MPFLTSTTGSPSCCWPRSEPASSWPGPGPLVEHSKNKPCVLSLREIATGHVRFDRDVREALMGKFGSPSQT